MKIKEINEKNFKEEVLNSLLPVLVDFNADWCGPCQALKPILVGIAEERNDFKIVSVNVDDNDELASDYDVTSIPCLVVIKNGKEVNRSVGLRPKEAIIQLMEE